MELYSPEKVNIYKDNMNLLKMNLTLNFIINWGNFDALQSGAKGITKQIRYYKVGSFLLQNGTGVPKRDNFNYKVGQLLQSREVRKLEVFGKESDELSTDTSQEMVKKEIKL